MRHEQVLHGIVQNEQFPLRNEAPCNDCLVCDDDKAEPGPLQQPERLRDTLEEHKLTGLCDEARIANQNTIPIEKCSLINHLKRAGLGGSVNLNYLRTSRPTVNYLDKS